MQLSWSLIIAFSSTFLLHVQVIATKGSLWLIGHHYYLYLFRCFNWLTNLNFIIILKRKLILAPSKESVKPAHPRNLIQVQSVLVKKHLSPVKRFCVFEHSVMTNFNCACPAIQRGQGSGFLSEGSS